MPVTMKEIKSNSCQIFLKDFVKESKRTKSKRGTTTANLIIWNKSRNSSDNISVSR
jgi:hypothetical protein